MNKPVNTTLADKVATPMNRRWFLRSAPIAVAAVSLPAVAIAAQAPFSDPHDRLAFHIEGVKQAMQEIDPTIKRWEDGYKYPSSPELRNRFLLTAYNYDHKEKLA